MLAVTAPNDAVLLRRMLPCVCGLGLHMIRMGPCDVNTWFVSNIE